MDSLTQLLLGAACAGLAAPARHRRAALLAGAALGTLPDLDVLALALVDDPLRRMVWHRAATHSLLVLVPFGLALWALLRRRWPPLREAPLRWLVAILAALATHPLLDAHTVYGTQLWWPLPVAPAMWATVFIIDPLYTVPLLVAVGVAWVAKERRFGGRALAIGMLLSSAYLGWSWVAKSRVDARFEQALAAQGRSGLPRFSVPTTFNTRVWRAVALAPDVLLESYVDVLADGPPDVVAHARSAEPAGQVAPLAAADTLRWFARGFIDVQREGDLLVMRDLRMGAHPHYFFRFAIAQWREGRWVEMPVRQLPPPEVTWERVQEQWEKAEATGDPGAAPAE
jgi:inner membrane protein